MDKEVLIQYCEMVEEIKDIRQRRRRLEDEIARLEKEIVSDTVKGTRSDGTYGTIKITGIAHTGRKRELLKKYDELMGKKEIELLELVIKAEEYIEGLENPEMRSMLRFSIIDGMTNVKAAECMNRMFPDRNIRYTDENVKKRIQRFFKNVPQCPD